MEHMCIRRFAQMSVESWKSYIVGKYIYMQACLFHIFIAILLSFFSQKNNLFFLLFFQNIPNTKAHLQHRIVLESCPDTDGMVWTGPLVLKRNCFNRKTKEKPLSKKPICGVLKICKSSLTTKIIHSEIQNVFVYSLVQKKM